MWAMRQADIFSPFLAALHMQRIAGIFALLEMRQAGKKAIDFYSIGRYFCEPALTCLIVYVKGGGKKPTENKPQLLKKCVTTSSWVSRIVNRRRARFPAFLPKTRYHSQLQTEKWNVICLRGCSLSYVTELRYFSSWGLATKWEALPSASAQEQMNSVCFKNRILCTFSCSLSSQT